MIPKADRLWYVQENLPLHRPVQVVQTDLKLGEVLLGALLTFDDMGIFCWSLVHREMP